MKNKRHLKSLLYREIQNAYGLNRNHPSPYALHFTNVTPEIEAILQHVMSIPDLRAPELPIQVTEQDHLDLFDADRLVYLSPDSRNDLMRVSDDDIYVIGALINKSEDDRGPLTLAKAKRLKIRHARFPIKRTIGMNCEMNAYNDWFFACRWVPARYMVHRATNDDKYRN